jgi:hypothetical protein
MGERRLGMTQTYNLLLDPDSDDTDIEFLRRSHEDLDRVVLEAYGWGDVVVPAYQGASTVEFADVVAGRLFALNSQRASSSIQQEGLGLRRTSEAKGPGTRKAEADQGSQISPNASRSAVATRRSSRRIP